MTQLDLYKEFNKLESVYRPLMNELTDNQEDYKWYEINDKGVIEKTGYKGWVWLQSKLIYQPDILFIGYNPSQSKGGEKDFYFPLTGERQFACFEDNNAYYDKKRNDKKCLPTYWYEFDAPENNSFYKQFLDIIKGCAEGLYPKETSPYEQSRVPKWFFSFGQRISFINLYPIAAKDEKTLKKILKKIRKKNKDVIIKLYKKELQQKLTRKKTLTLEDSQYPFIWWAKEFQKLIKPKLTVCLGCEAFHEFTEDKKKTDPNVNGLLIPNRRDVEKKDLYDPDSIIGIDRSKKWPIKAAVNEIVNRLRQKNP